MKKNDLLVAILCLFATALNAQSYTAHGFKGGIVGEKYQMPGTVITAETEAEVNKDGVVTGFWFDAAIASGADFMPTRALLLTSTPAREAMQEALTREATIRIKT